MKRVKNADNQKYLDTLKVCMGLNDIEGEDILRTNAIDLKKYMYDINKLFDNSFQNKDNIAFILDNIRLLIDNDYDDVSNREIGEEYIKFIKYYKNIFCDNNLFALNTWNDKLKMSLLSKFSLVKIVTVDKGCINIKEKRYKLQTVNNHKMSTFKVNDEVTQICAIELKGDDVKEKHSMSVEDETEILLKLVKGVDADVVLVCDLSFTGKRLLSEIDLRNVNNKDFLNILYILDMVKSDSFYIDYVSINYIKNSKVNVGEFYNLVSECNGNCFNDIFMTLKLIAMGLESVTEDKLDGYKDMLLKSLEARMKYITLKSSYYSNYKKMDLDRIKDKTKITIDELLLALKTIDIKDVHKIYSVNGFYITNVPF